MNGQIQTGKWYRITVGYNGRQGSLKTVEPRGNYEQKQIPLTAHDGYRVHTSMPIMRKKPYCYYSV